MRASFCAMTQATTRSTSAMTSGPIPSPGRSKSLYVMPWAGPVLERGSEKLRDFFGQDRAPETKKSWRLCLMGDGNADKGALCFRVDCGIGGDDRTWAPGLGLVRVLVRPNGREGACARDHRP